MYTPGTNSLLNAYHNVVKIKSGRKHIFYECLMSALTKYLKITNAILEKNVTLNIDCYHHRNYFQSIIMHTYVPYFASTNMSKVNINILFYF